MGVSLCRRYSCPMNHAPSANGLSGAPVAVSCGGDLPGGSAGAINGYQELSDEVFLALLDDVGPRGLWGAAATLLGGCSAATLLVGGLAYHLSLLWLSAGFAAVAALLVAALEVERHARRRALRGGAQRLGLSETFAAELVAELDNPSRRDNGSGSEGRGSSWPAERLALLRALQRRREQARVRVPASTSGEMLPGASAHDPDEGSAEGPGDET